MNHPKALAEEKLLREYAHCQIDIPRYFSRTRAAELNRAARWGLEEIRLLRDEVERLNEALAALEGEK